MDREPQDQWLELLALAAALALYLLPKTPPVVLGLAVIIFLLLLHPLWNRPWIKDSRPRQLTTILIWAIAVALIGYVSWPVGQLVLYSSNLDWIPFPVSPRQTIVVVYVAPTITNGYKEFINKSDTPKSFPTDGLVRPPSSPKLQQLIAEYQLQNVGDKALVDVTIDFPVTFLEPGASIKGPSGSATKGTIQFPGRPMFPQVHRQVIYPVLSPGQILTLYLVNVGAKDAWCGLPQRIVALTSGDSTSRTISLLPPLGFDGKITHIDYHVLLPRTSFDWVPYPQGGM